MDHFDSPINIVTFSSWLLGMMMDAQQSIYEAPALEEASAEDAMVALMDPDDTLVFDALSLMENALHNYKLYASSYVLLADMTYWVKPKSTTWFSRFLVEQYDNNCWISMFRMTKAIVFNMAELLAPHVQKKDTNYCLAVPVLVRVACTLFKLTHGANLTICSEMFAIGRSTVCKVLRQVVHAINDTFKHKIAWPRGQKLRDTQVKFVDLYSLPGVVGAIDGVHNSISKPDFGAADYFYFKSGGYNINCQAVVDSEKRFLDLYVEMPGSTNDSCVLRRSTLHYLASHGQLFDAGDSMEGHTLYLLGDLGYPLLPWLMVPHRGGPNLSMSEKLFNKKLQRGRCVVENAFGILKQSFRELLTKSELNLTFLPNVIVCCATLYNLLLKQSHNEVEELLQILRTEGLQAEAVVDASHMADVPAPDEVNSCEAAQKRNELGIYLTTRRTPATNVPTTDISDSLTSPPWSLF